MSEDGGHRWTGEVLLEDARRLVEAAQRRGVRARLLGGVAFFHVSPTAREGSLSRRYRDFDLVVGRRAGRDLARLFRELGYGENRNFNALHGADRLIFFHPDKGFSIDILVGDFKMCHKLALDGRLPAEGLTLSPAQLLLTKLQIVQIEDKDLGDAAALVADASGQDPPILDARQFAEPLGRDWGFYHTVEINLRRLSDFADSRLPSHIASTIRQRVSALRAAMEGEPKSFGWQTRARVGEKRRWYDLPEEV